MKDYLYLVRLLLSAYKSRVLLNAVLNRVGSYRNGITLSKAWLEFVSRELSRDVLNKG